MLIFTAVYQSSAQLPPYSSNYRIVFNEDFDSLSVDSDRWRNSMPWNQSGHTGEWCRNIPGGIGKEQYGYRKLNWDNCVLDTLGNGSLTIISKKEDYIGQVWNWPVCTNDSCNGKMGIYGCNNDSPSTCWDIDNILFRHTTNQLISKESFKYGYFEIRCKIPIPDRPKTNTGIGPNFWLWASESTVSWSEIDVFEFDGSTNTFGSAIHYEDSQGNKQHGIPEHQPLRTVDDSKFHTYAVHWEPHAMKFYFDDQLYLTTTQYTSALIAMPMIIDVNFPLHTMCQLLTDKTQLPHYYEIDFVRVYQLDLSSCNEYPENRTIAERNAEQNIQEQNNTDSFYADQNRDSSIRFQSNGEPCYQSTHRRP